MRRHDDQVGTKIDRRFGDGGAGVVVGEPGGRADSALPEVVRQIILRQNPVDLSIGVRFHGLRGGGVEKDQTCIVRTSEQYSVR